MIHWPDLTSALALGVQAVHAAIVVLGIVFLISGLDDLFIDVTFWLRALYRRVFKASVVQPVTRDMLAAKPEQWIAILVPAWDESAVIEPMLRTMLARVDYTHYRIFVGVYANDTATCEKLAKVCADQPSVITVYNPRLGPTNKADCLNAIYHGIRDHELKQAMRFEILVLQDSEDLVHPLAWRLFNWLIPRKDMVQLPVLSLTRRWWEFTAAHYMDEFAQLHFKDLVAREALERSVPAAGVGVAFSRRAIETVASLHGGEPFSTRSLTEDYDLAQRLRELGFKQVFVRYWCRTERVRRRWPGGAPQREQLPSLVCVREYFPDTLRAAVRQKSRWVIGIALQGWRTWGWQGSAMTRYMYLRDRKPLITNLATVAAYVIAAAMLTMWVARAWLPSDLDWTGPLQPGSAIHLLLTANLALLGLRALQRFLCTTALHGPWQGVLAIPRMVWGNLVNFLATLRALRLWVRHLREGAPISWDKTAHRYPVEALTLTEFSEPEPEGRSR